MLTMPNSRYESKPVTCDWQGKHQAAVGQIPENCMRITRVTFINMARTIVCNKPLLNNIVMLIVYNIPLQRNPTV
jgi:hypothetical protein